MFYYWGFYGVLYCFYRRFSWGGLDFFEKKRNDNSVVKNYFKIFKYIEICVICNYLRIGCFY